MRERISSARVAVRLLLTTAVLVGFSEMGLALSEPAPRAVLFRLHSAGTITGLGDSLQIQDTQLRAICETRGARRPSLIYEGMDAEATLYHLPLGSSAQLEAALVDLRAASAVADAQPDHFLIVDQASPYLPPTDLYYTRDYNPFPPFTSQDSLNAVFWPVLPHDWATCSQFGFSSSHLTFHAEDVHLTDQWPLQMTQTDLAWFVCTGDTAVKVGILDSGVDWRHPDLGANIWQNLAQDADADGCVIYQKSGIDCPDPPYCEWEFDSGDLTEPDGLGGYLNNLIGRRFHSNLWPGQPTLGRHDPDHGHCVPGAGTYGPWPDGLLLIDRNGYQATHGTQMASIIGAVHNGFGCVGMCAEVSLVPMNAGASFEVANDPHFDPEYLEDLHIAGESEMVSAIIWAIENGVDILNISLSCGDWGEPLYLKDKIIDAHNAGMIISSSAGNRSSEQVRWPASWDEVFACAVVNNQRIKTDVSSYGANVDFCAPAGDLDAVGYSGSVYMTAAKFTAPEPFWPDLLPPYDHPIGGIRRPSGPVHTYKDTRGDTSGGAAQLSGAFALLMARYPDHSREELVAEMVRGAVDVDPFQTDPNVIGKLGHGLINPYRSMTEWGGPRASELSNPIWSGDIWVSGDYTVPAGGSLTIQPGTTVHVANFDNERLGDPDHVEIQAERIYALGTEADSIKFVSYGPESESSLWLLSSGESAASVVQMSYCRFEGLWSLQAAGSAAAADTSFISNCRFTQPDLSVVQALEIDDLHLRSCIFGPGSRWTVIPEDSVRIEWCKFEGGATENEFMPAVAITQQGASKCFIENSIMDLPRDNGHSV